MGQYARNMDQIHALGAGVSMATSGASAILGKLPCPVWQRAMTSS